MKRVRYDGPHDEVVIFDSAAGVNAPAIATVQRGHLLPTETLQGEAMPARIRDEFAHKDNLFWSEVQQAEPKKNDEKDGA